MALHRLTQIVMGVPDVEQTAGYYAEFGLTPGTEQVVSVAGAASRAPDDAGRILLVGQGPRRPAAARLT